jgi:hypothetical protein
MNKFAFIHLFMIWNQVDETLVLGIEKDAHSQV